MAVQVTLVGEAGGGCNVGDCLAGFEQSSGLADPVGHMERVRRQAGALAEEPDEPELSDTGGSRELVEADVSLQPISEVVAGQAKCPIVVSVERRSQRPYGGGVLDHRTQPFSQPLILLKDRAEKLTVSRTFASRFKSM